MNVLWIVVDTLRSDHLGCYGYFRDTSPNIDQLAREGVVFEDSYASAIATGPGFTSLFTGMAAINHGFYRTPWNEANAPLLDDDIATLPELIQARGGYTTAAFDNLMNFRSHMKHFVRGFEFYVNVTRSPGWTHHFVLAEEVNRRLIPWLERHADEPFFAFVHYWDPHLPYNHPGPFRGKFEGGAGCLPARKAPDGYEYVPGWGRADRLPQGEEGRTIDLYDGEIFYTDHCIGEVRRELEDLGILDGTAVILTSDHGEDLGLHGVWEHSTVHETTIRVPTIIRDPENLPRGVRVSGFVQHADNLPTILERFPERPRPGFARTDCNMPAVPSRWDGESLFALARGAREAPAEIVVESGVHRAYLAPPWKLVWHRDGRRQELYHLANDPLELNDRAREEREIVRDLQLRLQEWTRRNLGARKTDPIFEAGGAWTCALC